MEAANLPVTKSQGGSFMAPQLPQASKSQKETFVVRAVLEVEPEASMLAIGVNTELHP